MMAFFYALSFLSGFFETGPLMMALSSGFIRGEGPEPARAAASAIAQALACALCYQIGNLSPRPLELSKPMAVISGIAGACCFILAALPLPPPVVLAARLGGTALCSLCVQSARGVMKSGAPKMLKRGARVAGFALGFFCTPLIAPAAAVLAFVLALASPRRAAPLTCRVTLPRLEGLNFVMIFHQMHYFAYCYAAFIAAFRLGGRSAAAAAFIASWIVYIISPLLYRKAGDLRKVFFLGHTLLIFLLLGLYAAPSMPLMIVFYLLTGIGGTTEFCIGGLAKQRGVYHEDAQGFSENLGHVLGTAFCLMLFISAGDLALTPLAAAVFALAAVACMAKTAAGAQRS
jgi:hypothetical protein